MPDRLIECKSRTKVRLQRFALDILNHAPAAAGIRQECNREVTLGRNLEAPVPAVFGGSPHAELAAFIKEHDPCPPGTSECGADDWFNLPQRMHYIIHLFRAYAEEPRLWTPPFTPEQVVSFRAGVIPVGEL